MKTVPFVSLVLTVVAIMLSSTPMLASDVKPESAESVRSKIEKMIKTPDLELFGIEETQVTLKFLINSKQEIVVVSTGTDNAYLDSYLKSRLNYKSMKILPAKNKIYVLDILFRTT
ncbi:MAG: hypothetical protein OEQ53_13870 [Saprospiraceae bacterium]|nr:hypothetical protein [Saprospiraceae bacterium]